MIRTYEDLLQEKARLSKQLDAQKAELNGRIRHLKEKLAPVGTILSAIGGITAMGAANPVLKTGVGLAVDVLLKKKLFKKSGLVTGLLGSFLVRNVATKIVGGAAGVLIGKLVKKLARRKSHKPPGPVTPE